MLHNLIAYLTVTFTDLKEREEGQGLVEYALILVLISVVAIAIMTVVGTSIKEVFSDVQDALT
jgi:pilus assembly protein Flp/PilA